MLIILILYYAFYYNPVQNILKKIKKSRKVRQDHKTLISIFAYFSSANGKRYYSRGYWILSDAVLQKCSYKKGFRKNAPNLQERPMPKCDFNKVALDISKAINFIEITLRHGRSPVKFTVYFQNTFL